MNNTEQARMKVAILSWYHYRNYGTALQAAALSNCIKDLGFDVSHIAYIPKQMIELKGHFKARKFKKAFHKVISGNDDFFVDVDREKAFETFISDHIPLTGTCNLRSDLYALNDKFDVFITGSDQIWSPLCYDPKYYLDFVRKEKIRISYAPSFGMTEISDLIIRKQVGELLQKFDYLSVRESQGAKLIKKYYNLDAEVVLDPTLLMNSAQWDELLNIKPKSEPYILAYFLGNSKLSWKHVSELSRKTGMPVKVIPIFKRDCERGFNIIHACGPGEFVSLIRNAGFICTDSFHALAFSITYHVPFFVYERFSRNDSNSQNSRIYSLLDITLLNNRLITKKNYSFDENCNFTYADSRIEDYRKKSYAFLSKSLKTKQVQKIPHIHRITQTCCGCGGCEIICPNNAVTVSRDEHGFLTAVFDDVLCTNCGLCKRVCPFCRYDESRPAGTAKLYSLKSMDSGTLMASASGGASHKLALYGFRNSYDVSGCLFDKADKTAKHTVIASGDVAALEKIRNSKYLQSNELEAFTQILKGKRKTLVFALPCQISAFDNISRLKNRRDDFVLVDLVCHGVPTQNLFDKYIGEAKKKYNFKENPTVIFRSKSQGWHNKLLFLSDGKREKFLHENKDMFYRFFNLGHCYAQSCYECPYRAVSSADIRIGDYWGERFKSDSTGVSMMLALTEKGETIIGELSASPNIKVEQHTVSDYFISQQTVNLPKPVFYEELMEDLKSKNIPLKTAARKYCTQFEFYKRFSKLTGFIKSMIGFSN